MSNLLSEIVGTWSFISWSYKEDDGQLHDYLGENSVGTLTYTSGGTMSVQIMKGDRKQFASGELMDGTTEEIDEAFKTFFAYFGTYEEKEPGVLAHHIHGSNFPNWVGKTEERGAEIRKDALTLTAPGVLPGGAKTMFVVQWERVP
ncbi:MAG: lipocalin-like domain-containing protein [Bacteroidota bacterium]